MLIVGSRIAADIVHRRSLNSLIELDCKSLFCCCMTKICKGLDTVCLLWFLCWNGGKSAANAETDNFLKVFG